MRDIRATVDGMAAGVARSALKFMNQRPGVRMYLYYSPAVGAEWGHLTCGWKDDELELMEFKLATPEPLPANRDSVSLAAWICDRGNLYRLPICGA